jgi:hypothetical protein
MHLKTFRHAEQRSVSAAPMYYEADGSIRKVPYWMDNVLEQIEPFNPFRRVPAATMAWGYGLKTRKDAERGIVVNDIDAGEYLLVKGVDFGARGARSLTASVQAPAGGCIEVHLDSPDGPLAGTLRYKPGTGWKQQTARLSGAKGVHDLCFVFAEGGFEWDWWTIK